MIIIGPNDCGKNYGASIESICLAAGRTIYLEFFLCLPSAWLKQLQ